MKERIQKILASRGIASRRLAEKMMSENRVLCNGVVCSVGDSADPEVDEILIDGKPLPPVQKHVYILLNKPRGYVTTLSDEKGRTDVSVLVKECGCRVYPVGRLDMDSEGLLILTNDGDFANYMMHPRHEVNKVYLAWVRGYTDDNLNRLNQPITLDGYKIKKPAVDVVSVSESNALLRITIHEGRNRQVRRMCAAAGMQVQRLKRIAEGSIQLGKLPLGKWRYLSSDEIASLNTQQ